jgi:hypothetical protein
MESNKEVDEKLATFMEFLAISNKDEPDHLLLQFSPPSLTELDRPFQQQYAPTYTRNTIACGGGYGCVHLQSGNINLGNSASAAPRKRRVEITSAAVFQTMKIKPDQSKTLSSHATISVQTKQVGRNSRALKTSDSNLTKSSDIIN